MEVLSLGILAEDVEGKGAGMMAKTEMGRPLVSAIVPAFNRREETLACVESLLASDYPALDTIVVDNGSTDGLSEALRAMFGDRIRLIRSEVNLFAGGGRNLGAKQAGGRYLLFVDSDNVVERRMVSELVLGMESQDGGKIGLCGPFMYHADHPDRLCWVEGDINLWTSLTWWRGQGEKDVGQYAGRPYIRVGHIPNVFMMERALFEALGGIDPLYRMHYEESDLAERVKRRGYVCALFPRAKTWHRIPLEKPKGDKQFAGANRDLLYLSVRNRILFMKRFASPAQVAGFFCLFAPLLLIYQLCMCIWNARLDLWGLMLRGYWDGWREHVNRIPRGLLRPLPTWR